MLTSAAEDLDVTPPTGEVENIMDRVLTQEQLAEVCALLRDSFFW